MIRSLGTSRKILLIGWDGADWKTITPLLDAGLMPNLQKLVDRGVMGNLATLQPSLSPMLWTSIATGKRPFKHGVLGFTEPTPDGDRVRPVSSLSRRTRAIWNILHLEGLTSNVIGWWPSHPVEPVRGVMVSNHYHHAVAPMGKPWPVRPGTIQPERLVEPLGKLRVHPEEVTAAHLAPFVPGIEEVDQQQDKRLSGLQRTVAECTSIHAAATALVQLEPWDFMAVYYDAIDHFSHGFMRYHPPRMAEVSEEDFELYKGVVATAYQFHDAMLGVLVGLAGDDVTVMLVSDHGFLDDRLRPRAIPSEPAGPAAQHSSQGIFVLAGPGIRSDELLHGASVLDITPTILSLYGLPVGEDMDGKPLASVFAAPMEVETIPSWDHLAGEDGAHPSNQAEDPIEAVEALNQLVALGYIDPPGEDRRQVVRKTVRELRYNEARSYMDATRHSAAAGILEALVVDWPDELRFKTTLVRCYQASGRVAEARRVLDKLIAEKVKGTLQAAQELAAWHQDHPNTKREDIEPKERHELRRLRSRARPNPFAIELLEGVQLLAEGDEQAALAYIQNAELIESASPVVHAAKGAGLLALKRWEEAEASFRTALELDPTHAKAHVGLARSLLPQRQNAAAAEAALNAVAFDYDDPHAHYLLGVALHRMGRVPRAIEALRVCLAQNPANVLAHRRLAHIYEKRIGNMAEGTRHRQLAAEIEQRSKMVAEGRTSDLPAGPVSGEMTSAEDMLGVGQDIAPDHAAPLSETTVVVTGLPRSGTSMAMQMLAAGGMPLLSDDERPPDVDNERGYFEYAPVRGLRRDNSWVAEARGRAFKVIAQLLPALPRGEEYAYRAIFMERDLEEIVASQRDMIARHGRTGAKLTDDALRRTYALQLGRLRKLFAVANFPVLYVPYDVCLQDPLATASRINAFLGGELDEAAMARAVVPRLRRHRSGPNDAPCD